ncbi:MAG: hypothetical protein QMC40_07105 [Vicingaceae bacterium]
MMIHLKLIFQAAIILLVMTFSNLIALGQENSSYEMNLVKVIDKEIENKVVIVMKVSPTIEDFKLIISGRTEYSFGRKTIISDLQKDPKSRIVVYGHNISTKAPELYNLIKDGLKIEEEDFLLVFIFSNIKGKDLAEGFFKYGLWESNESDVRNEQTFVFGENEIIKD